MTDKDRKKYGKIITIRTDENCFDRTLKVEVPYSLVALTVSGGTFVMFDMNSSRKWQLCSRWVVFMITCTNWMQTQDVKITLGMFG